ncbi:ATPase, F0 complex, subunit J [Umbelopsis sp. PMI_123]|nr:ATPase, F0 complex, subunit J [Umbelopsis sp. PMI_123]
MFGLRKFNTPILRPVGPFFIGTVAIFYLIGKAQSAMIESDEYKNDPRNPALASKKAH